MSTNKRLQVRMPIDLHDWLKAKGDGMGVGMSAYVIMLLQHEREREESLYREIIKSFKEV